MNLREPPNSLAPHSWSTWYAVDESAAVLAQALCMSDADQTKRMRLMRRVVENFDTYWWAGRLLHDALAVNSKGDTRVMDNHVIAERISA